MLVYWLASPLAYPSVPARNDQSSDAVAAVAPEALRVVETIEDPATVGWVG